MKVSISDLKAHVFAYVQHMGHAVEGVEHRALAGFAQFVEGKQAEVDAAAFLEKLGYTVTPPPVAAQAA